MNDITFTPLAIVTAAFVAALLLTIWCRKILLKRSLLDHPNERSSHSAPVPRGGGWAAMAVLVPGMVAAGMLHDELVRFAGIVAGTVIVILISWLDDKGGISAMKRLGVHIAAASLGSLAFGSDQFLFGGLAPFWLDRAVLIVGWAWFMNLYNFMDGIDGITGVETIAIASGVCALMTATNTPDPFVHDLCLLLTGTSLGFLALNWYPAKIFLGDVGSVPLGFLTGFALLYLATKGFLIPALIVPLYYLADSGITLAKRALRREKIWQAHRRHFYQIAARGTGRHDKVVVWIIIANVVLISTALVAVNEPRIGLALGALIVAILLGKMHKAGHEDISL